MAKIINYKKSGEKILQVTMQLNTPEEKRIFKAFLDTEIIGTCSKCGKGYDRNEISEDDYYIVIYSPTANTIFGFPTGTACIKCPKCGAPVQLSMMDLSAFKSISAWIQALKKKEAEKRGQKAKGTRA